eukprot:CAMPEP_0197550456 /NCGR_PEP_ID=MMETSP1320-20131121/4044_1 /TAXON_ID=91990 /ORGANISM="Bolidomonas sp., Strain RCC2347" /LENGTH=31 /DNA_ID= /DNA_START= /DNA_END= /DNA_ORIENTATION=
MTLTFTQPILTRPQRASLQEGEAGDHFSASG